MVRSKRFPTCLRSQRLFHWRRQRYAFRYDYRIIALDIDCGSSNHNQVLQNTGPVPLNSGGLDGKGKIRQGRVRSQLGNHQVMPLDSMNIVQQSSSQQRHINQGD